MDTQVLATNAAALQTRADNNANPFFHSNGQPETKAPKRNGQTIKPKKLTWFACQAVRLSLDGQQIERRSFPFFALSLEHARFELIAMKKEGHEMPFTDIYQYATLHQEQKKFPKMKLEANKINIETGKKS